MGKTRPAIHLATQLAPEFSGEARYVDLAPIADPDVVPMTVIRALGLSDQPGRSTMDTLTRFIADHRMLIVLDDCEHLLDSAADLVSALLGHCLRLTLLATSREQISVPGEARWRGPNVRRTEDAWPGRFPRHRGQRGHGGESAVDCPLLKRTSAPADAQPGDIVLLPDGRPGTYLGDNRALLPAANGRVPWPDRSLQPTGGAVSDSQS